MSKPFVIKAKVPLVNEAEVGRRADRGDAEILVANALKYYLRHQSDVFFDQGLELDGPIEVETTTQSYRDVDDVSDL